VAGQGDRDPVLESMPVGYTRIDGDWRITYINAAAEAVVGVTRDELVGVSFWDAFPETLHNEFGRAYREVAATGKPRTVEAFYPRPLNKWFEVQAVPDPPGLSLYFTEVTERRMAQDRLVMLARVSAELSGALDADAAASRIPHLLPPVLGNACLVTLVDGDGRPRRVSSWHVEPAKRAVLARYSAVRSGALPVTVPTVGSLFARTIVQTGAEALALLPEGEARDLLQTLAPRLIVTVPVRGRGRTVGALTIFYDDPDRVGDADLLTARDVADRMGSALDNARLFSQQRQLAEGLQRALLTAPFEPDHAEVVVRYIPAAELARVGGDWYDAFLQPSGSLMLVIGDVVGHDTAAAAAMGQLRALLRGIAVYSDEGPAEVLRGLDTAMAQLDLRVYATASIARLEQTPEELERGVTRMRWSNAGHLPLLVIHPDGSLAAQADWQGELLLGVDRSSPRSESVVTLERGATVLLFTDGLIERRDADLDTGMARLRSTAVELAHRPLGELCDELVERLVQGRPEDDVALVAVRLHPQDRPRPPEAGPERVPPTVAPDPTANGRPPAR
jgi:PAS domain S-box-containing protein